MNKKGSPLHVAILLYPGVTALDAVGPWEVLSRIPNAEIRFVGKEEGPVVTEGGRTPIGNHSHDGRNNLARSGACAGRHYHTGPDGGRRGARLAAQGASDDKMDGGALILGAAGILKGSFATTHWYKMGVLRIMGAEPQPDERIVRSGKIVTAAGVSAGIDLALWLAVKSPVASKPKRSS